MITAADRTTTRPPGAEQLIRRAGVGRRLFPVEKLEYWAANPRLPYTGEPLRRVRSRIEVRRDDFDGRPVYEVTPLRCGPARGHVVYLPDAVLLCPWLHVALPHPDVAGLARSDVTFNVDDLRAAGLRYAGGDPVDTPLVSPATGPLDGLPRLTLVSGTHDVLHPDTREFWDRAVAAGLDVDGYEQYAGRHLWMYLPGQDGVPPVFDKIRDRLVSAS
ncbi:MAG TPA: alpha/beta hydrolase fold domain-containing protein [Mycobacterium sp.]